MLYLLLSMMFLSAAEAQNCPPNAVYYGPSNKCYQFNATQTSWDDAYMNCFRLGGSLTSIHSEAENRFIASQMQKIAPLYWIGLNSEVEQTKTYTWSDHSSIDYTNWNAGVPDSCLGGKQPCVFVETYSMEWLNCWYCGKQMAYVCEVPVLYAGNLHKEQ